MIENRLVVAKGEEWEKYLKKGQREDFLGWWNCSVVVGAWIYTCVKIQRTIIKQKLILFYVNDIKKRERKKEKKRAKRVATLPWQASVQRLQGWETWNHRGSGNHRSSAPPQTGGPIPEPSRGGTRFYCHKENSFLSDYHFSFSPSIWSNSGAPGNPTLSDFTL